MKIFGPFPRAICIVLGIAVLAACPATVAADKRANLARYAQWEILDGARTLPVLAKLAYRDAISELRNGNTEAAEKKLHQALTYYPHYPDVYFTLSSIKLRQMNMETTIYLGQAFVAMWHDFSSHRLFVANTVVFIPYVLFLASFIVCFAFAFKYLPFAAHKVQEFLRSRMRAGAAGFTAYLLLLLPLLIAPGIVTTLAYLTVVCWVFMYRREKFLVFTLVTPFVILGLFGSVLRPFTPLTDPGSLTSLMARANDSAGDDQLIRQLDRAKVEGLEAERNIALGLIHQRNEQYGAAADHFFRSISLRPDDSSGYINLGNVYFLQGQYEKALEGYRTAQGIEPLDPVGQYALAQAYIKTLMMKESSIALQLAAANGIEKVKASYTPDALAHAVVLPKTFSNGQLWRAARIEGKTASSDYLEQILLPFTRFPRNTAAWILLVSLVAAIILSRLVKPARLTFQCGNCGKLTCYRCCNSEREIRICQDCAGTIAGVTSERVVEALLRQKRQAILVSRRKAARFYSVLLPGVRDISFGKITRGFFLAAVFSFSIIQIYTKGYMIKDPTSLVDEVPLWKLVLPIVGVVWSYVFSIFSKQKYDFRGQRDHNVRHRPKEHKLDNHGARVA
ncbi:MAG: tetratricopeptide repeat protein [Candidatus Krumholzibacteria bacterium]